MSGFIYCSCNPDVDLKNLFQSGIDLSRLSSIDINKNNELNEINQLIRRLIRAKENLKEAHEYLRLFEIKISRPVPSASSEVLRALFAFSCILYGACFLPGEGKMRPVEDSLANDICKNTHKKLREYRDNYFAHIDKNSELRADSIRFSTKEIENGKRVLSKSLPQSSRLFRPSLEEVSEFKRFIAKVEGKVNELIAKNEILLKELVGEFKSCDLKCNKTINQSL